MSSREEKDKALEEEDKRNDEIDRNNLNTEFLEFMKQQNDLNQSYLNQISDLQTAVFLLLRHLTTAEKLTEIEIY